MTRGSPKETCGDHGGRRNGGSPCGRAAGWGTDFDSGKCRECRGTNPDGTVPDDHGAPEGNDNAARHEMYAERNAYYQRRSDAEQDLIDQIYEDYCDEYERRHDREPLTGDDLKLFGIAVGLHKTELRADDWPDERPDGLESGHELVDRSEKRTAQGKAYYEYKPAAVIRGEKTVSQDIRMWLKDLGLFDDPDSQDAAAREDVADALREVLK